jgi:hypothetical protein
MNHAVDFQGAGKWSGYDKKEPHPWKGFNMVQQIMV